VRILVAEDLASSDGGGAERSMGYLCEHLSNRHELFLIYQRTGDWVLDSLKSKWFVFITKISTETFTQIGFLNWIKELFKLIHLCRVNRIEIIISHEVNSLFTLRVLSILTGIPVKYYFKWISSKPNPGRLASWGLKGLAKAAFVSSFIQRYWINVGLDENRTQVIREGVEKVSFRNSPRSELKKIVFAGRIIPDKGLHLVIKAIGSLKKDGFSDIRLAICGYFSSTVEHSYVNYHREIENLIYDVNLTEQIDFKGFVKPLAKEIASSDLAVLPSICQEASPLIILEALSVDTPIIARRVGGVPELLEGMEYLIFQPEDPTALAEKIKELTKTFKEDFNKRVLLSKQMIEVFDLTFSKDQSRYNLEIFFTHDE